MTLFAFGFNVSPRVDSPDSTLTTIGALSKIRDTFERVTPVRVLFAGWASLVLEDSEGKITIAGEYSPTEAELVQASKAIAFHGDPLIKFFGWECLQGFLSQTGKVVGLDQSGKIRDVFTNAKDVASCGPSADHLSVAIDKDSGKLYQWTASDLVSRPFLSPSTENVKFESIWAGEAHMLALASNGDLYSWGSGRYGQLGHGDVVSETYPKVIESLQGIRIESAACGSSFSIALSETGDVYTFGLNDHGQLGMRTNEIGVQKQNTAFAQLVDFVTDDVDADGDHKTGQDEKENQDVTIVKVACGTAHSVIIDDRGRAWSCGWGKYGQLGPQPTMGQDAQNPSLPSSDLFPSVPDRFRFQRVMTRSGQELPLREIACGLWNTFLWS